MRQWDVGGKLASLASLLIDHSEEVEADLARHYPRDADQLGAFYRGDMSVRRLWVLVSRVPQDSGVSRIRHGDAADWQIGDYILARLSNDFRSANASKPVPESKLIIPPGVKANARRKPAEMVGGAKELDALFTGGG